jgi:pyruvate dehydrogenase E2 component (dihydrolipoamide acetyltransferase)
VTAREIRIPDIGDAEDVEVVEILVAVGETVERDAPLIVIESDKASMEIPAPAAGRIARIDVAIGAHVKQDQLIALLEVAEPAEPAAVASTPAAAATAKVAAPAPVAPPSSAAEPGRRLEIRLPDVGDAKDITVVEVAAKVGAEVKKDDLLLVVESDKASMEIPSPAAGRIVEVAVAPGAEVAEGALLVVIDSAVGAEAPAQAPTQATARTTPLPEAVGSNRATPVVAPSTPPTGGTAAVYAGPAVRRLARELGVELGQVKGTGARGRIVKEDVQSWVKSRLAGVRDVSATGAGIPAMPVIDFAKFGPIEIQPLSRIRRRGAENLHRSWLNVPHVTQHDEADVTTLEAFRASLKSDAAARGVRLSPLPFLLRALVPVLRAFPTFNASLDPAIENLVLKRYIHIGLAVDTPDGLVVPVVRNVDQKGIWDLAAEIEDLSGRARAGKLTPADLSGGSFSVSSLGAIGGTAFTPIVNAPEVAILGVSRLTTKPFWTGTSFEPRQFLPVSLSYDHRAINGAEAGRFVTAFCATLMDLRRALL